MKSNYNQPGYQTGAASLIFVLLVSLVVMASTSGVFKTVKNTQEIGTAVNATSHAETGTWAAAEAFRLYLEKISSTDIKTLQSTIAIEMDPVFGTLTAENITVADLGHEIFQVGATFVNRHAAARSSAKMQVVYNVSNEPSLGAAWPSTPVVNFNGNLDIGGNIELLNNGNPVDLVVDGNINISGVSVNPIGDIHTSGTVDIGSKVTVNAIYADDDVTLANTISNVVRTMGNFEATGSATVGSVQANGDVLIKSSGRFDEVGSRKNILVNSGGDGQGVLLAGGSISIDSSGSVDSAAAIGGISIGNWFRVGSAVSMADIECPSQWWKNTTSLLANGSLIDCPGSEPSLVAQSGLANTVSPPTELTAANLNNPVIDVWTLKDFSNYFVEYDPVSSKIKVTVNNVNGLVDGTEYTLGRFNVGGAPHIDYLCASTDSSGNCISPSTPTLPLCLGYSPYNSCISYTRSTNTFSIGPSQTPPGVVFFDGNVDFKDGHAISSILASGNISTNGQFVLWAANRGAYEKVCEADADHVISGVKQRYIEAFATHYPSNLCDISNATYTPTEAANIGLAAGGVNPNSSVNASRAYSGGKIDLGASTNIVGALLAGDLLTTTGSVNIQGVVATGAQGNTNGNTNSLGNSTTIDFASDEFYNPLELPDMGTGPVNSGPPVKTAAVIWSRPL